MEEPLKCETPLSPACPEKLKNSDTQAEFVKNFCGRSLEDLFVVEMCAGSAKLSKIAHQCGFRTMAIDHTSARSSSFPICMFDLTDADDVETLGNFIEESADSILGIWIAPPCGTCSRAREKRLRDLEDAGVKTPMPLRSLAQPDQLDGLSGLDKIKVESANMLYASVYTLATLACALHIFLAIENPTNSHYWNTSPMQKLCQEQPHHYVTFHNCAHGGDRDKSTSLWVNDDWLDSLAILCDKSHSHKPWTTKMRNGSIRFATAEEAAYPVLLCERIVHCLREKAIQLGASTTDTLAKQAEEPADPQISRVMFGALPRGQRVKPLVAEYGHFITVFADPQRPQDVEQLLQTLPKGAKTTSRRVLTWGDFQSAQQQEGEKTILTLSHGQPVEKVHIGVPSEPDQFIKRAISAGHPRSLETYVDPHVKTMISANFVEQPADLAKKRVNFFKKYLRRATELKGEEDKLRSEMQPHVRQLVGNKRLALWREILVDYGYPDVAIVDDIASGFKLSGWMPKSHVFKARAKRPSMSMETLKGLSKALNAATYKNMTVRQEPDIEGATWDETVEEIAKGWIWFDEDQPGEGQKFIGKRFGIRQSNKVRVIDDCSCCGLNWTVGLHEKFQLQSIDILAAVIAEAFKDFPGSSFPRVLGRCYDLKSAYKQFAIHSADRVHLRMAVRSPDSEVLKLIGFNALPFGAVGSVAGFLRVSLSVWYIGLVALQLCWTVFYDDYSILSRVELIENTSWSVETLFELLGLSYAKDGKKFLPFDSKFKMLGLEVDLDACQDMKVKVSHTEDRKAELLNKINDILASGWLESKEAERLRGRMIFYEGYTFGRIANAAIKNIGRFCTERNGRNRLDDSLKTSLLLLRDRVLDAPPVCIGRPLSDTWIVFTDGACSPETQTGSIGGMVISPCGVCTSFFSGAVPERIMSRFFEVSKNPIHELEVLPVVAACDMWGTWFAGALVVYYIDNESARMAFVKGIGETSFSSGLIHDFVCEEARLQHRVWFGRCPSHSNPSDSASRLDTTWFQQRGIGQTDICWERLQHRLGIDGEVADRR